MADFYKLIAGERVRRGLINHDVARGPTGRQTLRYCDVRAAMIPPRPTAPANYVIAGEELVDYEIEGLDRGPLVVLKEATYDGLNVETFFDHFFADACLFCVKTVYVDLENPLLIPFWKTFREPNGKKAIERRIELRQAPFAENILAELSLIQSWREKDLLEIDRSTTLYEQAKKVSRDKLIDGTLPESESFLLEALCHLVGGFHVDVPPRKMAHRPSRPLREGAWMR
jgi:hypothetical protein